MRNELREFESATDAGATAIERWLGSIFDGSATGMINLAIPRVIAPDIISAVPGLDESARLLQAHAQILSKNALLFEHSDGTFTLAQDYRNACIRLKKNTPTGLRDFHLLNKQLEMTYLSRAEAADRLVRLPVNSPDAVNQKMRAESTVVSCLAEAIYHATTASPADGYECFRRLYGRYESAQLPRMCFAVLSAFGQMAEGGESAISPEHSYWLIYWRARYSRYIRRVHDAIAGLLRVAGSDGAPETLKARVHAELGACYADVLDFKSAADWFDAADSARRSKPSAVTADTETEPMPWWTRHMRENQYVAERCRLAMQRDFTANSHTGATAARADPGDEAGDWLACVRAISLAGSGAPQRALHTLQTRFGDMSKAKTITTHAAAFASLQVATIAMNSVTHSLPMVEKALAAANRFMGGSPRDWAGRGRTHVLNGRLAMLKCDPTGAEREFQLARQAYSDQAYERGQIQALIGGAFSYMALAKYAEAQACTHAVRSMLSSQPDSQLSAACSAADARIHLRTRQFPEAIECFRDALVLFQELGNAVGQAQCLRGLAEIDIERGRYGEARVSLEEARSLAAAHNNRFDTAHTIRLIGELSIQKKELDYARECFTEAQQIYSDLHNKLGVVNCFLGLSQVSRDPDNSISLASAALDFFAQSGFKHSIAVAHYVLGLAYNRAGSRDQATIAFSKAEKAFKEIGMKDALYIEVVRTPRRDLDVLGIPGYSKEGSNDSPLLENVTPHKQRYLM